MQAQVIDTLIAASWIVPVEPAGVVLTDHALAIDAGKILAVLPSADARARFAPGQSYELRDHALIPGLVNLHTHAAMTLMRGLADDLPLMKWLTEHIWPAEGKHVSSAFVHDGTLLACAEMLLGGITCFNDMYFFPEAAARAALTARMRAALGIIALEFPSAYASNAHEYLHKGLATRDEFRHEPLLSFCLAPHAPYSVSDKTFELIATYANQLDIPVHTHVHETDDEIQQNLAQHATRPLARLQSLGLLAPNFIAVHAVHLTAAEIELLAEHCCHVAHCPSSNLKLASGFAPVAALIAAGANVGVGTDGAASNNKLDMFGEMRLAALLAKAVHNRADVVPAHEALAMATLRPARALGLEQTIGSLLPGKAADVTAVCLGDINTAPHYDIVSHLVYAAGRSQVSHVWVNGELLVADGALTQLDRAALLANSLLWQQRLQELA